jgi:Family of unknown function (DUF6314)
MMVGNEFQVNDVHCRRDSDIRWGRGARASSATASVPRLQTGWTMNTELKSPVASWGAPADVFARLEGDWRLVRHVDGRPLMKGLATFTANDDASLTYHERGRVHLADGQGFEAERRYLYRASPAGFTVFFFEEPSRLFHDVRLEETHGRLISRASHRCKDDLYLSRYAFLPDGTFFIRHAVSGPRKSYTLETSYDRKSMRRTAPAKRETSS